MSALGVEVRPDWLRWELPLLYLLAAAGLVSIPLSEQGLGLSWDALNHHIYLGWVSEVDRFSVDFLAAAYQSYQFPYLYWPLYKMAVSGWSGMWTGVVLALLHTVIVPPVWMMARCCIPGNTVFDVAMRSLAVVLAFLTGVVLSQFGSTSNDLLAAAPLVWALAVGLEPLRPGRPCWLTTAHAVMLSGFLAGASVAFKLSNGPLAATIMPVLWLLTTGGDAGSRMLHLVKGSLAMVAGFAVLYGYWGAQLWAHFGNPVYPFYDGYFANLRALAGWTP